MVVLNHQKHRNNLINTIIFFDIIAREGAQRIFFIQIEWYIVYCIIEIFLEMSWEYMGIWAKNNEKLTFYLLEYF